MPRKKQAGTQTVRSRTVARSKPLSSQRLRAVLETLEVRQLLSGGLFGSYFNNMTLTGNPTNTRVDGEIDFNWNDATPVPGVGPDAFSVRWTGQVQAPVTQTYNFTTISNDGVRLWVNGEELINHWNSHPADIDSGSITLIAGENYNIEMDYFQNTGSGTAVLEWAGPGQTPQPITENNLSPQMASGSPHTPTNFAANVVSAGEIDLNWQDNSSGADGAIIQRSTDGTNFSTIADLGDNQSPYADTTVSGGSTYFYRVLDAGSAGQSVPSAVVGPLTTPGSSGVAVGTNGLLGVYYANVNFTSPTPVAVVDPQINFNWNSSSPAPGIGTSNYSVQWTGQLLAPVNGIYTLSTTTDDGVRMWLGSQEIINDFADHPATTDSAQVSLTAGQEYNVVIQYFNDDAPGLVQLAWTVPGQTQAIIPSSQLTPLAIPVPAPVLAAPTSLTATDSTNAASPSIAVSWSAVQGATSYDVYRGTVSSGEAATPFQVGITTTNFTDTAVTAGTKYFYEVTAVNAAGRGGDSPEASATISLQVPAAPVFLISGSSSTFTTIMWPAVVGASSYDIYRGTVSGGELARPYRTGIVSTIYSDKLVSPGTTYYYEVTAVNSVGQSGDSPEASATLLPVAPTAPAALTAIPSTGEVALSWPVVSTATSYDIYRGTVSGGESPSPFETGITATTFTDTAVIAGSRYFYEVTAVNDAGQSIDSREASATIPIPIATPATPSSLTATPSMGQITLSWPTVAAAQSYNVYRGTISGGESTTPYQTSLTTTNFTDSAVTAGSSYFYEVTAVNSGGESGDSPEALATVPLPTPVPPAGVTAVANSPSSISVSWLDEAYEAGFQVLQSNDGVNYSVTGTTQTGVTGYLASGLAAGQTYYFEIVATNGTGNSSASSPAHATTPANTSGFYGLTATPQPSEVLLAWPAQFEASSYSIFRGTSSGGESGSPIQTGLGDAFADTTAVAGTTYYYTVRAALKSGQVVSSSEVSAKPLAPVPSAPSSLLASALPSGILLNWSAASGATSYDIFRGLSSGNESTTPYKTGLTSTSFIDTAISGAGTYYYVVAGVNASGQGGGSTEASGRAPGISGLPAPTGLFATTNSTSDITVSWQDVPGETGFEVLRSTDGVNFSQITTVTSGITNYADSGLNPATTYYYQIVALGANGASPASVSTSAVTQTAFDYTSQPAPQPSDGFTTGDPSGLVTPTTTQPNNIFYVGMPVTFQLGSSAVSYQVRDYNGDLVDQGTANPTTTLKVTNPGWYKLYVYGNSTTTQYGNIVGTSTFVIFNNNPNFTQLTDLYDGGNYYFVDPAMTRVDPSINFNWTSTAPSPNMPLTEYGVAWTGQIQAQATQTYVFSTTSDDGVRLWVNGQEIINDWTAHGATTDFGNIALVAGQRYNIKLEYYQGQFAAQISLNWSSTTAPGVIIPPSVLYPSASSTTPGGLTGNYYIGLTSSDPSEDTVVHDITGMGPERINITDPTNPQSAIASVEADIATDDALYVGKDAERPSGLLISFTNGTSDLVDIKTIVTALQGQVEYWEGQNEPDTGAYSGSGYVPIEAAFYNTIKSVNPNLQVLGPAVVSITDTGAGLPWIQDFLNAGGGKYIDGFSFHAYNSNQGSLYQLRESLSSLTSLLQQYGLGNIPLWQTEQGYPTAIYGSYQPQIQGQWTMLQMMAYEQYGIPKEHNVLWYDDSHGFWDIPDFWQNDDGTLLPAAALMDNWSQELYGATFTQAYNFGSANNLYIGDLFTGPGKSVAAFMSAGQNNGSITLNVQGGSTLQVVDAFGNSTTVPVVNGQVTLTLPEDPVYVQMAPGQTINVVQQNWGADLALQSGTNASYSGSSASNNGINQIINGVQENWYWNGVAPWGTINDTDQGANIQITLPQQETISNVTIFAMPPWQLAGTLMDFDLQYYNSSIAQWVTLDHVVQQADTFGVFTPVDRTTADSFFDNQYIFQNAFSPVTTQQIRLVINSVSYGGGATQLVPESGGQASPTPTLTISEVEIFG